MIKGRHPDGLAYLLRTRKIVERSIEDNICQSNRCVAAYPLNLARLMRSLAIAEFVDKSFKDDKLLRQASDLFLQWAAANIKSDHTQAYYLAGVRAAILIGEFGVAQKLLQDSSMLSFHRLEADALKDICDDLMGATKKAAEKKLVDFLLSVRDPRRTSEVYTEHVYIERDALAFDMAWILTSFESGSLAKTSSDAVLSKLTD